MSVFRPSNINRRLVGTAATNTTLSGKGSPGNAGQIGPKKVPYLSGELSLGSRCEGGSCGGVFRANESRCGVKEICQCTLTNYQGFFICCGPTTNKWFVSPSCTQVIRIGGSTADAVTLANSCVGSCGWFVPTFGQLQNPGFCCRTYWDTVDTSDSYWTSTVNYCGRGTISMINGGATGPPGHCESANSNNIVRAFRCIA
jgi:hypothetical protein